MLQMHPLFSLPIRRTLIKMLLISWLAIIPAAAYAQTGDTEPYIANDTLRSFMVRKDPPYLHSIKIKYADKTNWNKFVRGTLHISTLNVVVGAGLTLASEEVTKWYKKDKFTVRSIADQYWLSFTTPPVKDDDLFIIDYIGHPCQGAFYYNALRSQGANEWQSALFCALHSTLWEYAWEGGIEQPSIQDLIITPIGGILFGELAHVWTIKMGRNGYKWYEAVITCIINPSFAINNGLKKR